MELADGLALARGRHHGVVVTIGPQGRPQLTNIAFAMDGEGVARISTTDGTVKVRNLRRDPRCSLYVPGDHAYQYVVINGTAELSAVAQAPKDDVVRALEDVYRAVSGDHPDWDDFRTAMVRDHRLVLTIRPEHAYGMIPR